MKIRSAPRVPRVRRLPRACTGQARGPPRRTQLCPCPAPRPPRGQRGWGLPPRRGRVPSRPCSALVPLRAAKEANARERRAPSPVCVAGLPGAPPRDGAAPTPLTRPRPDTRPSPGVPEGCSRAPRACTAPAAPMQASHPPTKATGCPMLVQPGAPSPRAAAPLPMRSSPRSGTLRGLWPMASPGVGERCAWGPPVPPPRGPDPPPRPGRHPWPCWACPHAGWGPGPGAPSCGAADRRRTLHGSGPPGRPPCGAGPPSPRAPLPPPGPRFL